MRQMASNPESEPSIRSSTRLELLFVKGAVAMHTPRAASKLIIGKGGHATRRQAFFWWLGGSFRSSFGSKVRPVSIILQTTRRNLSTTLGRAPQIALPVSAIRRRGPSFDLRRPAGRPSSRSATGTQCHSCNTEGKGIARHRRSVSSICRTR